MSATVAAALKKIAVAILTDKKLRKAVLGIVLGIIIIVIMPVVAVIALFNGDINIDTDRLQQIVVEEMSDEEKAKLQAVEDTMKAIETAMTEKGFTAEKIKEAQVLYTLALYDHSKADGFVDKLVGCFAEDQTDEQLIAAVNAAFGDYGYLKKTCLNQTDDGMDLSDETTFTRYIKGNADGYDSDIRYYRWSATADLSDKTEQVNEILSARHSISPQNVLYYESDGTTEMDVSDAGKKMGDITGMSVEGREL